MHLIKKRMLPIVFLWIMTSVLLVLPTISTNVFSQSMRSLTVFQPGDAVQIQVWELFLEDRRDINLSGDYSINPEGYIVMPIIGEVKVIGLTVYELMQILEERFSAYLKNPYIYVRPLIRVTLQGAFNQPGSYRTDPSNSLWDLIAMAGGPNARCNLERITVERGGEVVLKDILNSFEKGYSLEEIGIESGDQIIAPVRGGVSLQFILMLVNLFATIVLLYLRIRSGSW